MNRLNYSTKKIEIIVFVWFLLLLLIPFSGHRYSDDSTAKYETAKIFIATGSFNIELSEKGWGYRSPNGGIYTYFSIGTIIVMMTPALIVTLLESVLSITVPEQIVSVIITFQNLLITSFIGLFLFLIFSENKFSRKASLICSMIIVVGSEILQYSSTGWSEPSSLLLSLMALYFLKDRNWKLWAIFSSLAILIRFELAMFFCFFAILNIIKKNMSIKDVLSVLMIFSFIFSLQMIFNYVRYDTVLHFGYFNIGNTVTNSNVVNSSIWSRYLKSFYFSYLSFGRLHFIWVTPLILLSPLLLVYKEKIPEKILISLISASLSMLIIPFAGYNSWCWGNRYLYPFFIYLIIPLFLNKKVLRLPITKVIIILSIIISISSTLINSHVIQEKLSKKLGAAESIVLTASDFHYATFWYHIQEIPNATFNTFQLMFNSVGNLSWEYLRENCLDIWPVGMTSFFDNPIYPFILWIALILGVVTYSILIIVPLLKREELKEKKILIDILHPAHVHFFKNIARELERKGYKVIFTARDKEMALELLEKNGFNYYLLSKQKTGVGLILEMVFRTFKLIKVCLKEKPSLMIGIMGPSIAVAGKILSIPAWTFYDTENAWITNWFVYPMAERIYSPSCYLNKKRKNQILYPSYHELSYLHPDNFAPRKEKLKENGIDTELPFSIVRFVSWQASHDVGEKGIQYNHKKEIVKKLEEYGNVYITSEGVLPEELKKYELKINKEDIHHLLAYASLVIGESATMASEAAVLGTPAIYISDTHRGYTIDEEKKYGLVYNLTRDEIPKAMGIIEDIFEGYRNDDWTQKHKKLLDEKINTAEYVIKTITDFIEE